MTTSKLSELDYFLTWLPFFVVATVIGLLVALLAGVCVGVLGTMVGMGPRGVQAVGMVVGVLVQAPVSFLAFRIIVPRLFLRKLQARAASASSNP